MSLVSKLAPNFLSSAINHDNKIIEDFNLYDYINNSYGLLFFWPMDFTFVCPTELISFNKSFEDFSNRSVKLIGVSIDSVYSHKAWKNMPTSSGGIGKINYPMVSDISHNISKLYNVFDENLSVALRGTFLIDKNKLIRYESVNDLPIGRNIKEILRIIDALQFHEKTKKVCPAQWKKNDDGIVPNHTGISKFLSKNANKL
ncbi:MAG: peroxiredoxin [Enterobacteriaceae bacterium]